MTVGGSEMEKELRRHYAEREEEIVGALTRMRERDRLARLLEVAFLTECKGMTELKGSLYIAEYLLAHGVTLGKEKRETLLDGKCGSCKWAEVMEAFGGSKCYVRCENENAQCNRRKRNDLTPIRQRTCPACKLYERREG